MFRFEDSQYLYLLMFIPLVLSGYVVHCFRQKRRLRRLGQLQLLKDLMPEVSKVRQHTKFLLQMLCLAALIIALARPQFGVGIETDKRKSFEVIVALDVSNSMLAQDVAPSRLAVAKQFITGLVEKLSDDRVGLIIFAGDAFTQLPITNDYVSAKIFLDAITPSMVTSQGTDIAKAIRLAQRSFTRSKGVSKSIIIITDGENHEGGAEEAASEAAKKGYHLFIVGIGSPTGAPIPDEAHPGNYMKDGEGQVVITHLNADMCKQIASQGKGSYIYLDNSNLAHVKLMNQLNRLEKANSSVVTYNSYDEQFQWITLLALIFLLTDFCLLERKNHWISRVKFFHRK